LTCIDGRYAEETPNWLCIHKRWLKEPGSYAAEKQYYKRKPFTLRFETGEVVKFASQKDFAIYIDIPLTTISVGMSRMKHNVDKKARIGGKMYYLMEATK